MSGGRQGFGCMVGNPPFQGGTKISAAAGSDYRQYIAKFIARERTDRADLVAFFFLRAAELVPDGSIGFLATNTISQGDTRLSGSSI